MNDPKLITQEDLDNNPVLTERGLTVGDVFPEDLIVPEGQNELPLNGEGEAETPAGDEQPSPEGEQPGDGAADNVA